MPHEKFHYLQQTTFSSVWQTTNSSMLITEEDFEAVSRSSDANEISRLFIESLNLCLDMDTCRKRRVGNM